MKPWLFALGLSVLTIVIGPTAEAQNYPWCAQYSGRAGGAIRCRFVSFGQCLATVKGIGGFCFQNNIVTLFNNTLVQRNVFDRSHY